MNPLIAWFARNGVSANLLMLLIVVGGAMTLGNLKQEVFPEFSSEMITVNVVYPGAAPENVEEAICMRVEEALQGLADIKRIRSSAMENSGSVTVEVTVDGDVEKLLEEVKARVDTIDTFPDETEKPVVQEVVLRKQVIDVAVHGGVDEWTLRQAAEKVRDDIAALEGISLVELANSRDYEVAIEISENRLQQYGLTFDEVANAVRLSSLDLPGGSVKTIGGEILLRTTGQAYRGNEFEEIVLVSRPDGTRLLLRDVAEVIDGFTDIDKRSVFDDNPAMLVSVFRVGEQSALAVADKVHEYVESAAAQLPEGIRLTTWQDDSAVLASRIDLLVRNGRAGLLLVFLSLALFLKLRLAFWVAIGIPICFLGAVWLLPGMDISINLISLFAFIVVLGIVVDDAIVVGENIYTHLQNGEPAMKAAIQGAQEVSKPVIFAILTTIAAFLPLLMVEGNLGKIMRVIPAIVIATLIFSVVESLLVLPRHLSHMPPTDKPSRSLLVRLWTKVQDRLDRGLRFCIDKTYRPTLEASLAWRYLTLAICVGVLVVTAAFVGAGHIRFVFFPPVDADNIVGFVTMPQGTPIEATEQAARQLESAAKKLRGKLDGDGEMGLFRHVLVSVGGQPFREAQDIRKGISTSFAASHLAEVNIELAPSEERDITSTEIARRWRELTGPVTDALEVSFTASLFSTGEAINVELSSESMDDLRDAATRLKAKLAEFRGVIDIADSFRAGKRELALLETPEAQHRGITRFDLARQVRQGFYGEEAQRVQRGRDDVRVMVRYPREERRSLGDVEEMRIRTPAGAEVPFSQVAESELSRGFATIQRADRRRILNVTADVDQTIGNPTEINKHLRSKYLPALAAEIPGLSYGMEGEQREQRETLTGLMRGFVLALFLIYVLLAIPFRSYVQPFIVMSAIPFGIVGAIWGHVIMGMSLTILSMFGVVALTGVLVNDSLVLVDYINRQRQSGEGVFAAIRAAGAARFRPILLTSLTTFAGLTPILLERSMQARFLIPMAISLGFGVLFATFITLIFVPVSYAVLDDLRGLVAGWFQLDEGADGEPDEAAASLNPRLETSSAENSG